jgi:hypothetical protein
MVLSLLPYEMLYICIDSYITRNTATTTVFLVFNNCSGNSNYARHSCNSRQEQKSTQQIKHTKHATTVAVHISSNIAVS